MKQADFMGLGSFIIFHMIESHVSVRLYNDRCKQERPPYTNRACGVVGSAFA